MMRKKTPTIEEQGGLEVWINKGQSAGKWRCTYDDFVYYRHQLNLTQAKMCELFGRPDQPNVPGRRVSPQAMKHWFEIDDAERLKKGHV